MKAIDAERFLNELSERLGDTSTFDNFVRFVSEASRNGFTVVPYSEVQYKDGPRKEYGAMVFGQFENDDGELVEVASNPTEFLSDSKRFQ